MTDLPRATNEQLVEAMHVFVKFLNGHVFKESAKDMVMEFACDLIRGSFEEIKCEEPNNEKNTCIDGGCT